MIKKRSFNRKSSNSVSLIMSVMLGILILFSSFMLTNCGDSGGGAASNASSDSRDTGIAGSMSRFAIVGDYLYAIAGPDIQLFDITDPSDPVRWSKVTIGFDIETLFPYRSYLFIGSQTGMYIYDNANPMFPEYISKFEHARNCDPVVVQGDVAYVTLRSGTNCAGSSNQLDLIDISDIYNPELIKSYPMQGPKGLAIDSEKLFLCDDDSGLKVFDVTESDRIALLDFVPEAVCYDVIANSGILVVSGNTNLMQYDYTQIPIVNLSSILISE